MDCKQTRHTIQNYFEGELTQLERAHFDEHVTACAACGREVAAYRRVFSLLAELDHAEVPEQFADTVITRVRAIRQARAARSKASRASSLWWVGVGSQPLTRLIRYPIYAVIMLVAVCFPFVMLRGGIKEAANSFGTLLSGTVVTISTALEEFGVFYRLAEVLKKDVRILKTIFDALGSLAWWTGETVMIPGAVLIGSIIIFALVYRSAYKRRPHNASYSL